MFIMFLLMSEEWYCNVCWFWHLYANDTYRCCGFPCHGFHMFFSCLSGHFLIYDLVLYMYIYIVRERESEKKRDVLLICINIYNYIYICVCFGSVDI